MAEKKNQHYVPVAYLKRFSINEKTIPVFHLKENKLIPKEGSISDQCSKDYFYSEETIIEDFITEVETAAQKVIDNCFLKDILVPRNSQEMVSIANYIVLQVFRTLSNATELNYLIDGTTKRLIADQIRSGNSIISETDLDKVTVEHRKPGLFGIMNFPTTVPVLYDLSYKIIKNSTNREFVTSDSPAVIYNPFSIKNGKTNVGFAAKGILIFLPLSPQYTFAFYDPIAYQLGSKKWISITEISKKDDVDMLNSLQFYNALKTIYMKNPNEDYLKLLNSKMVSYRNRDPYEIGELSPVGSYEGKRIEAIRTRKTGLDKILPLSFLSVKKKYPKYYDTTDPIRDRFIVSATREFHKLVENGTYEFQDWPKYLDRRINEAS